MKVLLYTEGLKAIGKSGLGHAIEHQKKALALANVNYTLDNNDSYDILHINTYFIKSYFVVKRAKRHGKKIVYHAHSTEEDYINGFIFSRQTAKFFKWWLVKCYMLGDVLVTPTEYSKKLISSYKHLENKKIYSISNGIELNFFERDEKLGKEFRKKYGFTKKDKVIIGIGLYIERKGIVDFVELAKRMPEYKFIWFGYSPLAAATKKVRDAVRTRLDNLQFPGYVEQDEIKGALSGCDLYIFPTLEETEGIPIIEAGKNVYKAKDVDEFELKIKKIIDKELPDLTKEGYKIAKARDLKNVGKQLKEVYKSLEK